MRPYCRQFLETVGEYYNLAIFTASQKDYATLALKEIDPDKRLFRKVFYRGSCVRTKNDVSSFSLE